MHDTWCNTMCRTQDGQWGSIEGRLFGFVVSK
jgi:hypothetical protein